MKRKGWASCIVAGTGPSLTPDVAAQCRGHRVIAVNDAYRLLPFAEALYACDARWWDVHKGCPEFFGEKWSSHGSGGNNPDNDKLDCAKKYGLSLILGRNAEGFSFEPGIIHYGGNSGFQAVNLAIQFGAKQIILVGFDMKGSHFFGEHPEPLRNSQDRHMEGWTRRFAEAARTLPEGIEILNATPGSALDCFPYCTLERIHEAA